MRESLLGQFFFSLSDEDRKSLHQVLHTRHFNSRKEVVRLIEFMEKYTQMPDKSERGTRRRPLNKEEAYQWVFGEDESNKSDRRKKANIEYDDGKMRHLMSYTLETIRLFLAWDGWKSSPENIALHLCKSLKKRGLVSFLKRIISEPSTCSTPGKGAVQISIFIIFALNPTLGKFTGPGSGKEKTTLNW